MQCAAAAAQVTQERTGDSCRRAWGQSGLTAAGCRFCVPGLRKICAGPGDAGPARDVCCLHEETQDGHYNAQEKFRTAASGKQAAGRAYTSACCRVSVYGRMLRGTGFPRAGRVGERPVGVCEQMPCEEHGSRVRGCALRY